MDAQTEMNIAVTASDFYRPDKSYGFVTEKNRREQDDLRLPELNSGFDTLYWYRDADLTEIREDAQGCFLDSDDEIRRLEAEAGEEFPGERGRIPLVFKADVPGQGNYKVTVTIRGGEEPGEILIFEGCRGLGYKGELRSPWELRSPGEQHLPWEQTGCLSGEKPGISSGGISAGGAFTRSMTVNVCDIVPRGRTDCCENKSINIAVAADRPRISGIRIEEISCPTVYIAGDSTVTNQSAEYPYTPGTCYSGWGQMLSAYLDERIAVSNHAHSGLTTDSFRSEGHYDIVRRFIRPGDFYFMQFGHNDQKLMELKAEGGYRENLLRYIEECREVGAHPVIITPLARNTWRGNDGAYNDLLAEYGAVCLEVGRQKDVPVLDLHGRSVEFVREKGLDAAKAYFHPDDYTHSNDYGAYLFAGFVAEEIVRVCRGHSLPPYRFLAECVTKGFGSWEPPEKIIMPVRPKIYGEMRIPEEGAPLLSEVKNLNEPADRTAVLDMLIKTARFFPTNVYNDMFTDVVGHEWYAGTVECAYQNGMIEESLVEDGCFFPEREVTLEEFLVFAVNAYKSRKKLPEERPCAYDGSSRDFARSFVRAACAIGLLARDGSEDLSRGISRGEAVELCRRMRI